MTPRVGYSHLCQPTEGETDMPTYKLTATIVTEDTDDVKDLIDEFMNNTRSKVTFVQSGNLLLDIVDISIREEN
jgi:hypothetical protein